MIACRRFPLSGSRQRWFPTCVVELGPDELSETVSKSYQNLCCAQSMKSMDGGIIADGEHRTIDCRQGTNTTNVVDGHVLELFFVNKEILYT